MRQKLVIGPQGFPGPMGPPGIPGPPGPPGKRGLSVLVNYWAGSYTTPFGIYEVSGSELLSYDDAVRIVNEWTNNIIVPITNWVSYGIPEEDGLYDRTSEIMYVGEKNIRKNRGHVVRFLAFTSSMYAQDITSHGHKDAFAIAKTNEATITYNDPGFRIMTCDYNHFALEEKDSERPGYVITDVNYAMTKASYHMGGGRCPTLLTIHGKINGELPTFSSIVMNLPRYIDRNYTVGDCNLNNTEGYRLFYSNLTYGIPLQVGYPEPATVQIAGGAIKPNGQGAWAVTRDDKLIFGFAQECKEFLINLVVYSANTRSSREQDDPPKDDCTTKD